MAGLKVLSKTGKLRAKKARRGRPRVEGVVREANGRISRAARVVEPADRLALEVRARKMGVTVDEARDPRLATYIGRLARLGAQDGLSARQYEAAIIFLEIRNNYQRAILSPAAAYEERVGLSDGLSLEEVTKRAVKRYKAVMRVIEAAQAENPYENFYAALQYIIIEDRELPHMVGTLRLLLNALAKYLL